MLFSYGNTNLNSMDIQLGVCLWVCFQKYLIKEEEWPRIQVAPSHEIGPQFEYKDAYCLPRFVFLCLLSVDTMGPASSSCCSDYLSLL